MLKAVWLLIKYFRRDLIFLKRRIRQTNTFFFRDN